MDNLNMLSDITLGNINFSNIQPLDNYDFVPDPFNNEVIDLIGVDDTNTKSKKPYKKYFKALPIDANHFSHPDSYKDIIIEDYLVLKDMGECFTIGETYPVAVSLKVNVDETNPTGKG
jgi:hypothetical protein